ncbi:hypothetical protein V7358_13940 [Bacillus pumilus]|uniref:hypothetical protein n=1 Tax=Bacillus pumilus TaxID=1408 RepID=UPI003000DC51
MDDKDAIFNKLLEIEGMSKEEWEVMFREINENGRRLEENEKRLLLERVKNDHMRRNALSLIFGELRDGGITAREGRVFKIAKEAIK